MNSKNDRTKALPILAAGLAAISMASVLIKLCSIPALSIAAGRLGIASALYTSYALLRHKNILAKFSVAQLWLAVISGAFLAIHFAAWITSLHYTTVASSVVLVACAPVFVSIGQHIFLKEKINIFAAIGIAAALIGSVTIGMHDFGLDTPHFLGNVLAVSGAIAAAGYLLAGRKLRHSVDTLAYVTVVYFVAAVFMLAGVLLSGTPISGFATRDLIIIILIAIIPQMVGHTSLNWALKFFSATSVAMVTLGEPLIASILAFYILNEQPAQTTVLGGSVIIIGVALVLLSESLEYKFRVTS
jgi:drug/metabolite transporter (DMT)-like permease